MQQSMHRRHQMWWPVLYCFVNHLRSGVVYNLGSCLYVSMSVCLTITFERLDVWSSCSHMQYISRECRSSSYMKVIGSRSRSQGDKKVENSYSRNVKLRSAITPTMKFACSIGFSTMADYYYYYAAFNAPCVSHKDESQARCSIFVMWPEVNTRN